MQYTIQQLQGGPRYSYKTKIGNWNEDLELETIKRTNYQMKKTNGQMAFAKTLSKYQQSYKQVPWSFSPDGNLKWGSAVMIQSAQTEGWLVVDVGDKVPNVNLSYSVTSTGKGQNPGPMTRSIFKLMRQDGEDVFGHDECIKYGQKVRI
jgi:hypothetical protein